MAKIMTLKTEKNTEKKTENRAILHITGKDAFAFLQGLITNDMAKTALGSHGSLIYTALLSPQGKYLFDFFVLEDRGDYLGAGYLIDIDAECADGFCQRLTMYKLRADVQIEKTEGWVGRGLGDKTGDATVHPDPRHGSLGWRSYHFDAPPPSSDTECDTDWNALYVRHLIPKTGVELIPNETYILEAGFERLNGVDFQKGCYVGQEVTARMKHKTTLRKGLARVRLDGVVAIGTDIMAGGKSVGKVLSQADGRAIAYLRFEQAKGEMVAGGVLVVSY